MKIILLLVFTLISAYALGENHLYEKDWTNYCYKDFYKHVSLISGNQAVDCGFAGFDASKEVRDSVEKCAKDAVIKRVPYKFGYAAYGDDSAFCDVAVRDNSGKLWSIQYDSDVTGGSGANPEPGFFLSECKKILFQPGTIGKGSFFAHEGCEENHKLARKILATP